MSTQLLVKGEKVDFEMRKKVLLAALLVSKLVLYLLNKGERSLLKASFLLYTIPYHKIAFAFLLKALVRMETLIRQAAELT